MRKFLLLITTLIAGMASANYNQMYAEYMYNKAGVDLKSVEYRFDGEGISIDVTLSQNQSSDFNLEAHIPLEDLVTDDTHGLTMSTEIQGSDKLVLLFEKLDETGNSTGAPRKLTAVACDYDYDRLLREQGTLQNCELVSIESVLK